MPDAVTVLGGSSLGGGTFLEGSAVKLMASAVDYNGDQVDPSLLRLLVLRPQDSVPTAIALTTEQNSAVGVVLLNRAGLWKYRFETTTGAAAAYEGTFTVTARQVPAP